MLALVRVENLFGREAAGLNFKGYVDDVLAGGRLRVVDGEMAVPQAAGLGAELDEASLARWELTEERKRDLDAYWHELKGVIGTSCPSQDHLVRHY